ncbi:MAG: aminotransferase class I/II-fold pyridoxal phosphate-dependent enzyme [Gammaproteobacteria bacterium]|nr:aminotransferase class I/II-fold pyridoxal phosphate-dependent enzyme [Gammaproteobacteria bacterium]
MADDVASQIAKHLNLNIRGLGVSATLAINERSAQLQAEGRQVYRLGLGQSPFPVPGPVMEELRANAHQKDYLPVRGLRRLRDAVAEYHRLAEGIDYSGKDVLVGPGSKELMFLLQLVYYGDLVIPTPSWVSYAPQAQIVGRHIRWLPTTRKNGWRMLAADLEKLCAADPDRPRIVILNYPNNPSGTTYAPEELQALAAVARRYRIVLLSDEIYGETHYQGRHVSIARYYPEGTIVSSGLSKWCGAGGWRLGTFTFPSPLHWLLDTMAVVASESYTSVSAPIQYAAVRAFTGGLEIERYLQQSRRILAALAALFVKRMKTAGVRVARPAGGFYLFPDFGAFRKPLKRYRVSTSLGLCEKLLEDTGIAILPGSAFGRPERELTARLAFVDFDGARALVAAEAVAVDQLLDEEFLNVYCVNVTGAADRLVEWLHGL